MSSYLVQRTCSFWRSSPSFMISITHIFSCKADKSNLFVSVDYNTAGSFVSKMEEVDAENADWFMNSLHFNDTGYLLENTKAAWDSDTILLNFPRK